MAFTPPPSPTSLELAHMPPRRDQPTQDPNIRPFSQEAADAQIREVQENFRQRPISSTSTTTISTTATVATTAARMNLPAPRRSSIPLGENDPNRPQLAEFSLQKSEKLPSFNEHFKNIADMPRRAGLTLPALDPLKEHNLSPEMLLELHYYDQLLAPSEYDLAKSRRQAIDDGILRLRSSRLNSNQQVVEDYLSLLNLKMVYNLLGIDRNYIDFEKKIKIDLLKKALSYLVAAGKALSAMKQHASISYYNVSKYSEQGDYLGDYQAPFVSHDIFVRESLIIFLQAVCCFKINKMALTEDDACGMHEAYPLYQKSSILINCLSTVNNRNIQTSVAQMNSNLAMLAHEIACRSHVGTCYEYMKKITSNSKNTSSTSL